MAIKADFDCEDKFNAFLERTDAKKVVKNEVKDYSWTFGRDEDDEGFTREVVTLEVPVSRDTEPKHVKVKLTPSSLVLTVMGRDIINDRFTDHRWLCVEDSYWELGAKTSPSGEKLRNLKYLLFLRSDYPKYVSGPLFEKERAALSSNGTKEGSDCNVGDSDDEADTADARLRMVAGIKEEDPHRDKDIWFSSEDEFSEDECEGCGSKSVNVTKKAEDREFKIYCDDCPYVGKARMYKEAKSYQRQEAVKEARMRKKLEKERKARSEKLAIENSAPVEVSQLEHVD
eukprot:TRINITY_DN50474_c0_g1_i1.p1 TRINITY_DN50474_c0_g1~~TRINITY_DN50474_c0_g1_i1.p1  ORF type:complete len:286 (-),score=61.41 TRINITY_DN50474_c0_g1_i1:75-932(-)